jgi:hypothetical protein
MFDTDTLQTLLNLPDIAIDRLVLFEQQILLDLIKSTLEDVNLKHAVGVDALRRRVIAILSS